MTHAAHLSAAEAQLRGHLLWKAMGEKTMACYETQGFPESSTPQHVFVLQVSRLAGTIADHRAPSSIRMNPQGVVFKCSPLPRFAPYETRHGPSGHPGPYPPVEFVVFFRPLYGEIWFIHHDAPIFTCAFVDQFQAAGLIDNQSASVQLMHQTDVFDPLFRCSLRPGVMPKACANPGCDLCAFDRCSKCRDTCYCSRQCQKQDWRRHRLQCVDAQQ